MRVMNDPAYLLATSTCNEVTKLSRDIQLGDLFNFTLKSVSYGPRRLQM